MAVDENAKVAQIRDLLLSEARGQADRLVAETEREAADLAARERAEVDRLVAERRRQAHDGLERERRSRLAAAASAGRANVLAAQAAVLDRAVEEAGTRMKSLRGEPGYAEWLKALILEGALALAPADRLDVLFDSRDAGIMSSDFLGSVEVVLTFSHNLGVHLEASPQRINTQGGVVLQVRGSNVRCDNTFEERLRAARPELQRLVASQVLGQ